MIIPIFLNHIIQSFDDHILILEILLKLRTFLESSHDSHVDVLKLLQPLVYLTILPK